MASLTLPAASSMARRAAARSTPPASITIRSPRSRSFSDSAIRSTIRLPYAFPLRIMAPVVIVLSASLVAVPALSRVEPVTTSGPTGIASITSTVAAISAGGVLQVRNAVRAPSSRERARAARTNGVVPLAAMPITTSRSETVSSFTASAPATSSSSAPSWLRSSAARPPAITPTTMPGGVPNVGGHSVASSTPSRPLVPAPTYTRRPPAPKATTTRSITRASSSRAW